MESDGTVSAIEAENYGIVHLTYTEDDRSVTYCRNYQTCTEHGELYNFTNGGIGGGSDTQELPDNTVDEFYITGVMVKL